MAVQLKDALNNFFEKQDIKEKVEDNNIFVIWNDIVGENIAKVTEVDKFKNNILFIKTNNSAWRSELSFQKEAFKEKIFQKLPKMKIKDIRFV